MKPIPPKTPPYSVLIIAEQKMIPKQETCPECNGEGCVDPNPPIVDCYRCKGSGEIDSETDKVPAQPLTEADLQEFYNRQEKLLAEYGFKTDHYGEKNAMIKRLTVPKPESEYKK